MTVFRYLKNIIIFLLIFIFVITSVLLYKQYSYFQKGIKYEHSNNLIKAVDNYAMVIYMHTPISPFEHKAINRILTVANHFKKEKNTLYELYCYERLRSSIYGIRSYSTPYSDILKNIEKKILLIKTKNLINAGYKKSYNEIYSELQSVMQKDLSPDPFLSFVVVFLLLTFVFITIYTISVSCDKQKVSFKKFAYFLPILIIIYLTWLYTLYKA